MERFDLVANFAQARQTTLGGRDYLVAPLTMIVPGVLPGSKGPLYYPPSQIARNYKAWGGMPITIYHPFHPLTNEPLSASEAGVWERQGIGHVYNPVIRNRELKGEAWIDLAKAVKVEKGREIINRIHSGQPIELSTGLYTENIDGNGYDHRGRAYDAIATNYRPDHLAFLPDQVGACSIKDGCGVLINSLYEREAISARTVEVPLPDSWKGIPIIWDKVALNQFCPTGAGGGVDPSCGKSEGSSHAGAHGGVGHGGGGGHEHGGALGKAGHEFEHGGHTAHTAHEGHEIAEALGGGHHEAVAAVHEAHEAHDAAHAAHEAGAHAAGGLSGHQIDAAAIVATHLYSPALKAAAHIIDKVPGGARAAEAITRLHDGATKVAEAATNKLVERYGKATAGAILGSGSLLSGGVMKGIGLGHFGKALPGKKFIGSIPLLAVAETGKRLGLVGPDSKLEKGLATVGTWVHATREAIGKPFKAVAAGLHEAGLKGAALVGKATGRMKLDFAGNALNEFIENYNPEGLNQYSQSHGVVGKDLKGTRAKLKEGAYGAHFTLPKGAKHENVVSHLEGKGWTKGEVKDFGTDSYKWLGKDTTMSKGEHRATVSTGSSGSTGVHVHTPTGIYQQGTHNRLVINDKGEITEVNDDEINLSQEEIDQAAQEFIKEVHSGFAKLIGKEGMAHTPEEPAEAVEPIEPVKNADPQCPT